MGYSNRRRNFSSHTKNNNSSNRRGQSSRRRGGRNRAKQVYIDPARFIKEAKHSEVKAYTPVNSFSDFVMHGSLKRNITKKGFINPTPVQDQTIEPGLDGQDIIGIAGTGTGKTTAFALPVLHRLISNTNSKALIIAPTRELAQQIEKEISTLTEGTSIRSALIIGGANMRIQIRNLSRQPQIIIGTPGRIKNHLDEKTLRLGKTDMVVLDEVDRMLDMGFLPDVTKILGLLPENRQSFFFSATMEPKIMALISSFTNNPHTVELQPESTGDNIHQNVVDYRGKEDKIEKLHDALINEQVKKVIVFDETKYGVDRLKNELKARGFNVDAIHGGKSQGQRQRALARFKSSDITILIATDVAARGIDVADVTHVINYSIPQVFDDYIHRIGRAGRAGRVGYALTFVEQTGSQYYGS